MGVIFASAKDGKNVCSACYFCPTPVTPSWPGLRTQNSDRPTNCTESIIHGDSHFYDNDGTNICTDLRYLPPTAEITDDHLHVLLKYYYNVYLSYS